MLGLPLQLQCPPRLPLLHALLHELHLHHSLLLVPKLHHRPPLPLLPHWPASPGEPAELRLPVRMQGGQLLRLCLLPSQLLLCRLQLQVLVPLLLQKLGLHAAAAAAPAAAHPP